MLSLEYLYWSLVACNLLWYACVSVYAMIVYKKGFYRSLVMFIENMKQEEGLELRRATSQLNVDYETILTGLVLLSILIPCYCFAEIFNIIYNYFKKENKSA